MIVCKNNQQQIAFFLFKSLISHSFYRYFFAFISRQFEEKYRFQNKKHILIILFLLDLI